MTCACESIHPFPCQFPGETEFFEFDGKQWCRFHLPWDDGAGNPSDKVGWRRDSIEWQAFETEIFKRLGNARPLIRAIPGATGDFSPADFRGITFLISFDFRQFEYPLYVDFEAVSFGQVHGFFEAVFGDATNFHGATFREGISFHKATFGTDANFTDVTFDGRASFGGATLGTRADFTRATFDGYADFSNASFGVGTKFTQAIFTDVADFSDTAPAPNPNTAHRDLALRFISFRKALFNGPAIFENRDFATSSLFDGAIFENLANFHGCKFHQGIFFHEAYFRKTIGDNNTQTAELEQSYRTLKRAMADLHARNEETDFFALEMECRRQRGSVPWFERLAATAYKHLSDYGRSIVRPLLWLGGLMVFAFLFYAVLFYWIAAEMPDWPRRHLPAIFEFTLEQMFSPFKIWWPPAAGKSNPEAARIVLLEYYPPLVKIFASLQSLFTIALLALFLLALRRRFKMD